MSVALIKLLFDRYGYFFLFGGAFVEGFHIMLIGGFLSALHYVSFWPAFAALALGNFSADLVFFLIGHFGRERAVGWFSKFRKDLPKTMDKAKIYIHKYPLRIFFLVKITTGLAIATILTAGVTGMKIKRFLINDFLSNLAVVSIVVFMGYVLGGSYAAAYGYFDFLGWALLAIFLIGILVVDFWSRRLAEKI